MVELKPPPAETLVGLEAYKSREHGIGGTLKQVCEDFIVEEVMPDGKVAELDVDHSVSDVQGNFVHFTLQKSNWETIRAVKEVADRLRVSNKRLNFAGTKDKRSISTQRVSVYGVTIDDLKNVQIKDILLKDFQYADDPLKMGELWGNRFSITVRGIELGEAETRERFASVHAQVAGGFPNFFGLQRFGELRPITHLVGLEILRGNIEGAVWTYLTKEFDGEPSEEREFRKRLDETRDFKEALNVIPRKLGFEAAMLNHLVQRPDDYSGAIRVLPKSLSMMFIHAFQSFIFNQALSECLRKGFSVEKLPLVGTESGVDDISARILEKYKVKPEDFRIHAMPELSSRGEYRDCFKIAHDFKLVEVVSDELNQGKIKAKVQFKLEKGCYATVFLREFMKN